jgi:hypothetical protein
MTAIDYTITCGEKVATIIGTFLLRILLLVETIEARSVVHSIHDLSTAAKGESWMLVDHHLQ